MTEEQYPEQMARRVWSQLQVLVLIAALTGAIAGWLGSMSGGGEVEAAQLSARFHLALFILLPLGLGLGAWRQKQKEQPQPVNRGVAILVEAAAGLLGSLAGNLAFFLIVLYIPTIFGDLDWAALQASLLAALGWVVIAAQVGLTTLSAIPIAFWLYAPGRH